MPGKPGFCTWSGCFDLQSVPSALERKCHAMSSLCVSTEMTLAPRCWGKLGRVPVFGQYLEPTALGALQHPQMSTGDYTERLWAESSETAYSLCFEKAQHFLTELNVMPDTSTAEAWRRGKSPAFLCWSHAGPWEDYRGQELCCEHHLLWGQCQPLGRTLLPLLQPRAVCSST